MLLSGIQKSHTISGAECPSSKDLGQDCAVGVLLLLKPVAIFICLAKVIHASTGKMRVRMDFRQPIISNHPFNNTSILLM